MSQDLNIKKRYRGWWWLAALLSGLVMVAAIAAVIVSIAIFKARSWVETWDNQVLLAARAGQYFEPSSQDWQTAEQNITTVLTIFPFSPDYQELAGRVYESRYPMRNYGDPEAQPFLDKAANYYRQAIQQRPTWPFTYMALAKVLLRSNKLNDEYLWSMQQALHYGPWEPIVLMMIVDNNLEVLPRLQPETRSLVIQTAVKTLSWEHDKAGNPMPYAQQLWARVQARKKQYMLCAWLPMKEPAIRARCLGNS